MKRIGMLLLSAGIGLMLAATCPADTQTETDDPPQAQKEAVRLEEMVVTATKTKKEMKDTPASLSVIKADELDSSPNMTLDEAFRYTPSMQIIRGEGVATVHNFTSIRGIGDSRNLLYIDGVNMVESMSGNTNLSFLPTAGVERIEILRGPFLMITIPIMKKKGMKVGRTGTAIMKKKP